MKQLSDLRYEEIKKIVVNVFEEYEVNCTPISGFEIASKMGLKAVPYSAYSANRSLLGKLSEDGFSIQKDGQWYLYYNDLKPYDRINFTLMHEIGHVSLDHWEENPTVESEANFFAKFSLAPPVLIYNYNLEDPYEISTRFEISFEAACYAYDYYNKWLRYGGKFYTQYEMRLCEIFGIAV